MTSRTPDPLTATTQESHLLSQSPSALRYSNPSPSTNPPLYPQNPFTLHWKLILSILISLLFISCTIKHYSNQKSDLQAYQYITRQREQRNFIHHDGGQGFMRDAIKQSGEIDVHKNTLQPGGVKGFPKLVWTYISAIHDGDWYYIHALQNLKRYTTQSGYKLHIIHEDRQFKHLLPESEYFIKQKLGLLYLRGFRKEDLKYSSLQKDLLKLYTLIQHGGVWIDPEVFLFQPLTWLQQLPDNLYIINRKQKQQQPDIFTFHEFQYNHYPLRYSHQEQVLLNTKTHLYFVAALPGSGLLKELLEEYTEALHVQALKNQFYLEGRGKESQEEQMKYQLLLGQLIDQIIANKQGEFNILHNQQQKISISQPISIKPQLLFAVHYYKLHQMRADMFSHKISFISNNKIQPILDLLLEYTEEEVGKIIGPMRYLQHFQREFIFWFNQRVEGRGGEVGLRGGTVCYRYLGGRMEQEAASNSYTKTKTNTNSIVVPEEKNSELYARNSDSKSIALPAPTPAPTKPAIEQSFPRLIWIYWSKGFQKLKRSQQLCLNLIKKYSRQSNYKLILLDDQNYKSYLSLQGQSKLHFTLEHIKMVLEVTTKADLLRMLLLIQNGGVWIDLSTILLRDLGWLDDLRNVKEIFHQKSKKFPQVFMMYNSAHGGREFVRNLTTQQRIYLSPIYQIFFIAAKPGSAFLVATLDKTIQYLMNQPTYYLRDISNNNIIISDSVKLIPYLIPMMAIQFILQTKQRKLNEYRKYAVQEYQIWGMDSRVSAYKIQTNGDFGFPRLNQMMLLRSVQYVEGCLGRNLYYVKLNHYGIPILQRTLMDLYREDSRIDMGSYYIVGLFNATEENRRIMRAVREEREGLGL